MEFSELAKNIFGVIQNKTDFLYHDIAGVCWTGYKIECHKLLRYDVTFSVVQEVQYRQLRRRVFPG